MHMAGNADAATFDVMCCGFVVMQVVNEGIHDGLYQVTMYRK